jgi:mRNA-degrading endonuclease RelE of RelBE toxin-antitoxin system
VGYTVIFRKSAQKEFEALSQGQKKALFQKLKLLEEDAAPSETVQLADYAPLRRIKAGDARAIYDEPDARGRIFILRVGGDHSIYDDLGELVDDPDRSKTDT